jgi:hypothetical protein
MGNRVKRTYNLSQGTVRHVRELAGEYGLAKSQDAVVELAVEQLYSAAREREEAEQWASASHDPEFRAEMAAIAADFADGEAWPR